MFSDDVDTLAGIIRRARPEWMRRALCIDHPEINWFPARGEPARPALQICGLCAVRAECLAFALPDSTLAGIWGGATPSARRAMRTARHMTPTGGSGSNPMRSGHSLGLPDAARSPADTPARGRGGKSLAASTPPITPVIDFPSEKIFQVPEDGSCP